MAAVRFAPIVAAALSVFAIATASGSALAGEAAFRKVVFARGFDQPVLLTNAPGEPRTVYVVEQTGRVLRVQGTTRRVFLDLRDRVDFGGERGLLGLAFDPGYASNKRFYVAYTSKNGRNTVDRFRSNGVRALPSSRLTLLSVPDPYGNHNGGQLAFGPDGLLYTTIGDGGAGGDPEDRSQDMQSQFGKLLTLNPARPSAGWSVAALGLRNAWRFSFDRLTGDLYIGDVGQRSREEVNYTPRRSPGLENYGWNRYEGTQRFSSGDPGPGRLVFPVVEYGRSDGCTVVGGYVYRGLARAAERGRYVYGDYCEGTIWSFRISGGEATDLRREPITVESLSSFGENAQGELFAIALDGTIYRLS